MVRVMTVEDYKRERELIDNDSRHSFELRIWMKTNLINIFREINHCFPYEMEIDKRNND